MPNKPTDAVPTRFVAMALLLMFAASASVSGCCGSRASLDEPMSDVAHKLDAPLRAELRGAGDEDIIGVFLGLESISDEHLSLLVEAGLEIKSSTENILAARGTRDAILRAARNSFVHRIELSRERPASGS